MSKTVNNNVQPSVYAFYNAAQEAISKNKASAVIKAKLGTKDVIISSASTSRKSTLATSWNAFEKSLRETFGDAAANKALTAMTNEGHSLSARNISIVVATAQEEFDRGMFVSRETHEENDWAVATVDRDPYVSRRCEKIADTLADQCMSGLTKEEYEGIAKKYGMKLPENFAGLTKEKCEGIAQKHGMKLPENFDPGEKDHVRTFFTHVLKRTNTPEMRDILTGQYVNGREWEDKRVKFDDFATDRIYLAKNEGEIDDKEPIGEQVAKLQNLIPGGVQNREKFLSFAAKICAQSVEQGGEGLPPPALDLALAKDERGRHLVITLKHPCGPKMPELFGEEMPRGGEVPLMEAVSTVTVNLDEALGQGGVPKYVCKTGLRDLVKAEFEEMSAMELLKYADDGNHASDLRALANMGANPKIKWLAHAGGDAVRRIKSTISDLPDPELKEKVFDFFVQMFDGGYENVEMLIPLLADRIEHTDVGELLKSESCVSDFWDALFDGLPVKPEKPENLDGLSVRDRTKAFYNAFESMVERTLVKSSGKKPDLKTLQVKVAYLGQNMVQYDMSLDGIFCLVTGCYDDLNPNQFKDVSLYDPDRAESASEESFNEQLQKDYERTGCNCTFGEGKPIVLSKNEYKGEKGQEFLEGFNKFTVGMSKRQQRVLGYGLTQAGCSIAGLTDNYKDQEPLQKLSGRKEDGSVDLTISFLSKDGKNRLSYTFNVDVNGDSKLTQIGTVPQE